MTTTIIVPKGDHPLYHHQDQAEPQPGRIWLHIGGRIVCGYDADPDSVTLAVHHGETRQYAISPYVSRTELDEILKHLMPLMERVLAGLTREWDGRNYVGRMTEDAAEADEDIRDWLDDWLDRYEPDGPWEICAICSAYGIRTYGPTEQMTPIDYSAHRDGLGREHETMYACQSCAAELPEEA
tara:strand:+ start:213 stop:761 length:549 start_codon:yes stop_codon:yes gene_type:complete